MASLHCVQHVIKIHFVSSECLKGNGKKIPNAWFLGRSAPIHHDILRSRVGVKH